MSHSRPSAIGASSESPCGRGTLQPSVVVPHYLNHSLRGSLFLDIPLCASQVSFPSSLASIVLSMLVSSLLLQPYPGLEFFILPMPTT